MVVRGSIIEIVKNPRAHLKSTEKYIGEPAEVLVCFDEAYLIEMIDGSMMTVDASCVKELK